MLIPSNFSYETLCAIWYYLHNLKHVKNTHGGVLLLVKLQAEAQSIIYDLTFRILLLIH